MKPLIKYENKDFLLSEQYVSIVVGLDNFFRANDTNDTDAVLNKEGLVPINLTKIHANEYTSWDEIIDDFENLKHGYRTLQNDVRSFYMLKQIDSLVNLVKWSKKEMLDFRSQVRGFLFVNDNPFTPRQCETLHAELQEKFKSIGLTGNLQDNYQTWCNDRKVPLKEIESTLNTLLEQARTKVAERMFPEVENINVKVNIVHDVPYSAYCDYVNETMIINGGFDYTYESLKHLATHEVFPGHTTHMHIRETEYKKGNIPADAALVITNTASSPIFEGIGDNGLSFIDWDQSINDEISDLIQRIKSVSGMNASYELNELNKTHHEVKTFLKEFAFGQEEWINSRMRFISHPLRGPFIYSYYRGYEGVRNVYSKISNGERSEFFNFLYKNMLTIDELKTFK